MFATAAADPEVGVGVVSARTGANNAALDDDALVDAALVDVVWAFDALSRETSAEDNAEADVLAIMSVSEELIDVDAASIAIGDLDEVPECNPTDTAVPFWRAMFFCELSLRRKVSLGFFEVSSSLTKAAGIRSTSRC